MKKLPVSFVGAIVACAAMGVYAAPDFSMIGYATVKDDSLAKTTGGAGGTSRTITNLADLQTWAAGREKNTTPEIVTIDGKFTSSSSLPITIKHGANLTIIGAKGEDMNNVGFNFVDYKNVIVQSMTIHEVAYPNDAITIDASHHIWINQCELYSKIGVGITVDTYDGLLDIKKGAHAVTVSWCRLHDHMKCSLVGHTDNTSQQAEDSQIRVTYHHDWFYKTNSRNPSLRFGAVHMFNNIYEDIGDYGVAARDGGYVKAENCHYNNVVLPMSTDEFPVTGLPNGYICQTGNTFTGTCGSNVISQTGCDFWNSTTLPYSYTLDPVASLETIVKPNSGVPGSSIPVSIQNGKSIAPSMSEVIPGKSMVIRTSLDLGGKNVQGSGEVFDIYGRKISSSVVRNRLKANAIFIVKVNSDNRQ
jgi:pectate lyase